MGKKACNLFSTLENTEPLLPSPKLSKRKKGQSQGPLKAEKHLDKTETLRGNKRGRVQSHSQ